MKTIVNEKNMIQLEDIYNPVRLQANNTKEQIDICMRDGGFEMSYYGKKYAMFDGNIKELVPTSRSLISMNKDVIEFAAAFEGVDRSDLYISGPIREEMIDKGVVVIYGHSDDCIEFDGAIYDETYSTNISVIKDKDGFKIKNRHKKEWPKVWAFFYPSLRETAKHFDGTLDPGDRISWLFDINIPHRKFKFEKEGNSFDCGLVFSLNEIEIPQTSL